MAHDAGIPLVVDATLSTPYLVRPIEHGADIVIHSATKFLGGHGTTLGGVIVESGRFNWGNGKFPTMTEPVASYGNVSWWGNFGEYGFLTKLRCEQLRDIGPALSPQSAFQLLQGVETLPQRLDEHLKNAQAVAEWLEADERVAYVNFSGLPSHPHFERAQKYLPLGPGSVFSFGVKGGRAAGQKFIESLQLASHLANVGDSRTLVIHPGSTTHQQLSPDQLESAGVPEDLVRISVGLEDIDDILWDLDQALDAASEADSPGCIRPPQSLLTSLHDRSELMSTEERTWTGPSAPERLNLLRQAKSIAIVGASDKPSRASYFVATYLQSSTRYKVYFVNPVVKEILGAADVCVAGGPAGEPGHRGRVPQARRPARRPGRGHRRRRQDPLAAAGLLARGRCQGSRGRRTRRRDGPLREDRACPVPRRPAPGRLRHRRHLLQAAGPGLRHRIRRKRARSP